MQKDGSFKELKCSSIRVGDIIKVNHSERVPCDMILIKTTDKSGGIFIKTDQLDGETDWKFREALTNTQKLKDMKEIIERKH